MSIHETTGGGQAEAPPTSRTACFTPAQAGIELGLTAQAVTGQLRAAPRDGRDRIITGLWKGAYRTGTRWHIPPTTLAAVKASQGTPAAMVDLMSQLEALRGAVEHALHVVEQTEARLVTLEALVEQLRATPLRDGDEGPAGWPPDPLRDYTAAVSNYTPDGRRA